MAASGSPPYSRACSAFLHSATPASWWTTTPSDPTTTSWCVMRTWSGSGGWQSCGHAGCSSGSRCAAWSRNTAPIFVDLAGNCSGGHYCVGRGQKARSLPATSVGAPIGAHAPPTSTLLEFLRCQLVTRQELVEVGPVALCEACGLTHVPAG